MEQITIITNENGVLQQPLDHEFSAASTTGDVIKGIDLTGKTAIVTGGYAGLGLETTRTLVAAGAHIIVPVRDRAKAAANLNGIADVEIAEMDLMNPASIDAFAASYIASGRPLHLLINNAGIMWVPLQRDARGYESHFATNHLGHFQLTARLWSALKQAGEARIINLSSRGHHLSAVHFDDLNFEHRHYEPGAGYGQSKTANILFSVELDKRGAAYGVRSYAVHPGGIAETDLKRHMTREQLQQFGLNDDGTAKPETAARFKTIAQGAATQVWCATSEQLDAVGGVYCEDVNIATLIPAEETSDAQAVRRSSGVMYYAVDAGNAATLWDLSEKLTGISFII